MRQTVLSSVSRPAICQLIKSTDPGVVGTDPHLCAINTDSGNLVAGETIFCCIGSPNFCFFIIEGHTAVTAKPDIVAINSDAAHFIAGESIFHCDCLPDIPTNVISAHTSTCTDPDVFLARRNTPNLIGNQRFSKLFGNGGRLNFSTRCVGNPCVAVIRCAGVLPNTRISPNPDAIAIAADRSHIIGRQSMLSFVLIPPQCDLIKTIRSIACTDPDVLFIDHNRTHNVIGETVFLFPSMLVPMTIVGFYVLISTLLPIILPGP